MSTSNTPSTQGKTTFCMKCGSPNAQDLQNCQACGDALLHPLVPNPAMSSNVQNTSFMKRLTNKRVFPVIAVSGLIILWLAFTNVSWLLYGISVILIVLLIYRLVLKKEAWATQDILAALGIVVSIILAISSAVPKSNAGPEETVMQFIEAVNQGDIATVDALKSTEARNPFSPSTNASLGRDRCPGASIQDTRISGSTARVIVQCSVGGTDRYTLIQENEEWKVRNVNWND